MSSAAVVEHFDVAADGAAGVVDAGDRGAVDVFDFERGEERFGLGVGERCRLRSIPSLRGGLSG